MATRRIRGPDSVRLGRWSERAARLQASRPPPTHCFLGSPPPTLSHCTLRPQPSTFTPSFFSFSHPPAASRRLAPHHVAGTAPAPALVDGVAVERNRGDESVGWGVSTPRQICRQKRGIQKPKGVCVGVCARARACACVCVSFCARGAGHGGTCGAVKEVRGLRLREGQRRGRAEADRPVRLRRPGRRAAAAPGGGSMAEAD